jgi:tRNA A-37 threonylcarbamoyl transferase component Bud32
MVAPDEAVQRLRRPGDRAHGADACIKDRAARLPVRYANRLMRQRVIYAEPPRWATLIAEAPSLVESRAFCPLKDEGRTRAGFLDCDGGAKAFIRRSRARSWAAGLVERIRGSRARRSLRGAAMLERAGFRCPKPLAAMEMLSAGSIRESYILTEALEDAERFSVFALGPSVAERRGYRRRKTAGDAVAREVRRLHDARLYTGDLQETNIMVAERDGAPAVYFVDLEDFHLTRFVSWRRRMLNLVHLDRSIGRFVGRAAKLAFLYAYLGGRPEREARGKLVGDYLRLRQGVERSRQRRRRRAARKAIRG